MAKQSEYSEQEQPKHLDSISNSNPTTNGKKPFIEPELSSAVDVLEATTFFQAATSGATN